jgi:hypothetical protein
LLCLVDYMLFSESRRLKYRDVYYACVYPALYVVFTTVTGFAGFVYYNVQSYEQTSSAEQTLIPVRFPYFFSNTSQFARVGTGVHA